MIKCSLSWCNSSSISSNGEFLPSGQNFNFIIEIEANYRRHFLLESSLFWKFFIYEMCVCVDLDRHVMLYLRILVGLLIYPYYAAAFGTENWTFYGSSAMSGLQWSTIQIQMPPLPCTLVRQTKGFILCYFRVFWSKNFWPFFTFVSFFSKLLSGLFQETQRYCYWKLGYSCCIWVVCYNFCKQFHIHMVFSSRTTIKKCKFG